MGKSPDKKNGKQVVGKETPNFRKPVWPDLDVSCEECNYNSQDIDTFPCATCHTRH